MPKNSKKFTPPPNIAFVGAKLGKEPLRAITDGDSPIINLPANQSKPFYHKRAKTIIRLYGYLYKPVIQK
jgi:hypothetical protein